ncbi:EmrA/EmrK family multidrug efflux transporter periplasmic adaptor subunit [Massilia terrae]|uniref:HlyD family efflux transporter periplasmic adaptor subunit n=1 Tax=Massilia terrae TaxID=1811224 RepID=A0ABT2CZ90_9BURK|nr:HlyD family efflux transporter periplasmic adaptor subunit [Massilia terrae]MCS0659293.1 HlyD family efflux transporter periplasmic adaptor subunit [Massilia terrae]
MSTENNAPNPKKRRAVLLGITVLFVIAGLAYAAYYVLVLSKRVQTDNAYVGGNLVNVTSQVSGSVIEIRADETQLVQAGTEIIRLDPSDAQVALAQAEARLGTVVRQARQSYTNVQQFDAAVAQRKVALKTAEDDLARRLPLAASQIVSGEDIAHARQNVQEARAALDVAQQQAAAARVAVAGVQPQQLPAVQAAKADYLSAWLAARRNAIVAPVTGYVAKRNVQVGQRIAPGTALLTIVPLNQLWVDANFKESELRDIRVGQPVTIESDIYGSDVKYHGRVEGLSAGTGSAFSLLPAQNASGNWIKVVQRVPVRISLDPKELQAHPLRVGLSATVDVDITNKQGSALGTVSQPSIKYETNVLNQPLQEAQAATDAIVARNMAK